MRIDLADGHIAAIHHFDAVTQLRGEECEAIEIGRVAEPEGDASATLLDHMEPGTLLLSHRGEKRRKRFAQLARSIIARLANSAASDLSKRLRSRSVTDLANDRDWGAKQSAQRSFDSMLLADNRLPVRRDFDQSF